ncbi:SCA7, zinc-binding domain-containing protein [Mycena floridula]|nr:SCA7, zinc-binding domain-containing protein [Mycena floridula]
MTLTLKPTSSSPTPFSWNEPTPSPPPDPASLPSPPTQWLTARDMKLFGAQPLSSTSDIGVVKCQNCSKPVLRSCIASHVAQCRVNGSKNSQGGSIDLDDKKGKKRKGSPTPDDPSLPAKKKAKTASKGGKGRIKGPVDFDRHCGVINDKGLECSRSLTCKSHSMGAKRAVLGRSRPYDDLLLDWQRANNPNFVEPVKRESKAEKKEKRDKEKLEKKRLAEQAAAALGLDPTKKSNLNISKKSGKKAAAASAVRFGDTLNMDMEENFDDFEELVQAVRSARERGVIGQPLAIPCDAGSWFVQSRERARVCRDLLLGALGNGGGTGGMPGGLGGSMGMGLGKQATPLMSIFVAAVTHVRGVRDALGQ